MHIHYRDLVEAVLRETRTAPQARLHRVTDYINLFDALYYAPKTQLLIVTFDSQEVVVDLPLEGSITRLQQETIDMSQVVTHLESYFSWFGNACAVYVLGDSVAIFHMNDSFSVSHILRTSLHDISIPGRFVDRHLEHLDSSVMVRATFTVNPYSSDSLSLNTVLALLKHVDRAAVLMVRRVNRLGFDGATSMEKYFSQFGRVIRIFMLPLKSRKKNVALPPKTGFLVMQSPEVCDRILAHGEEHDVLTGISVSVGPFTHRCFIDNERNIYDTL
jgi:hypothetical protein